MLREFGIKLKSFVGEANEYYKVNKYTDSDVKVDFIKTGKPGSIKCSGLGVIEGDVLGGLRWGLGPATKMRFKLARKQDVILRFSFQLTFFEEQSITVKHNGVVLAVFKEEVKEYKVILHGVEQNTLTLEYTQWNRLPNKLFPGDNRGVAVQFRDLVLVFTGGKAPLFLGKEVSFPYIGMPKENEDLALKEYAEGKTVLQSLPPIVTLALTTYCNNKRPCVICDRNTRPETADSSITTEMLEKAKPLIKTARYLLLHCGGEPLMSKYFEQVLDIVTPPTLIAFATNAMLLTPKKADLMLEKKVMGAFTVSMDAATPETYRIMRPSCNFEKVTRNVKYYTSKAKELKQEKAKIFLNMSICETNLEDVPAFVDLANELGASLVEYNHLNPGLTHIIETVDGKEWDYLKESKFSDPARHDELVLEAWNRAQEKKLPMVVNGKPFIGPDAEKLEEIAQSMKVTPFLEEGDEEWKSEFHTRLDPSLPPCYKPWQETVIQPNGNVRLCYYHDEEFLRVGNILDNDFLQLWNSDEMIADRKYFLAKGVAPKCDSSHPCMRCRPKEE